MPGVGCLESGCLDKGSWSRLPGESFLKQGTGNRLPKSGILGRDAFYRVPGAGCLEKCI